jgi:transportin-3
VQAILNLPENCHIAIRFTSINILGELCDWIDFHPETLEAVLNFLLQALKHKSGLAGAAANALQLICTHCKKHMVRHMSGLMEIARYLEMFELQQESSIALIKGISNIISRLPNEQIDDAMRTLCNLQVLHKKIYFFNFLNKIIISLIADLALV